MTRKEHLAGIEESLREFKGLLSLEQEADIRARLIARAEKELAEQAKWEYVDRFCEACCDK